MSTRTVRVGNHTDLGTRYHDDGAAYSVPMEQPPEDCFWSFQIYVGKSIGWNEWTTRPGDSSEEDVKNALELLRAKVSITIPVRAMKIRRTTTIEEIWTP